MPADNKKLELRSRLAGKTTEELEELLALDFAEDKQLPDAEYISTVLEVIEERENGNEESNKKTIAAWNEFQDYRKEAQSHEELEAGISEKPTHDHRRIIEYRQKFRKRGSALRVIAVAAAVIVLLCGTAFGWNLFQAIAEWTEETFYFLTSQTSKELPSPRALEQLKDAVALVTDTPCVPQLAPAGTQESGTISIVERNGRCSIGMGYLVDDRMFSIRITIFDSIPEDYISNYQKDATIQEEYVVENITHYIVCNNKTISAMWTNGCVEGYIQGNLTIEELRQMISSIYEEKMK